MNSKKWIFIGIGALVLLAGIGFIALRGSTASLSPSTTGPLGERVKSDNSSSDGLTAGNAKALFAQAERARIEGSLVEAKQLYQQILQQAPPSDVAAATQQKLGEVNLKLIFSPAVAADSIAYEIQSGDTLSKIARKFRTTVQLLEAANGLTNDRIQLGQKIKVSQAVFSVIVDKSQNTLTLKNREEVLKVYRCSTGMGGITPVGTFRITSRIINPPWFSPEGVVPSGDPRNPLGSRWLGFDLPKYGIHGTTDPSTIGKPVTHGCIRLANAEVEELFILLPEQTVVTIVE